MAAPPWQAPCGFLFLLAPMKRFLPLVLLAMLQAADYASTRLAFAHGAVELNPATRGLGIGAAKVVALLVIAILVWRRPKSRWLLWSACGVYLLYVANNLALAVVR